MAIVLEANYAKKLGLPGYSSHQYSVSIRTELTDLSQVEQESSRLYRMLQDSVDQSIQETGFLPGSEIGNHGAASPGSNGANGHPQTNGHHHANGSSNGAWRCSDKQRDLIGKIVSEKNLDKSEVEQLALDLFGLGVRHLDRLQASGLIDELFERYGDGSRRSGKPRSNGNGRPSVQHAATAAKVRTVSRPAQGGFAS